MANQQPDLSSASIDKAEHIDPATTGDNIAARKVANYGFDGSNWQRLLVDGSGNLKTTGSGGGGGAVTVADGADVAEGATTDLAVAAGSAGSVSGKLRQISADISSVKTNTTGIATSAKQDTGNTSLASIDTKTPALGQALAAASSPVVLPAAQITTLTPPTNTGYALDSSLSTIDTDLKSNITLHAGTNLIGKVGIDQTTPGTTNAVAIEDGSGNALTSNSTTYTAKKALDGNLLGTLGTAFTTAGKVDTKAADGDVFVRSNAGSTFPTTIVGNTTGGLSVTRVLDTQTTATTIKGSAGQLYGYYLYNNASATRYVKIYNKTGATQADTPILTIAVPPLAAANVMTDIGIAFSTAIGVRASTGVADNDTGAPTANDVVANFYYT